MRICAGLYKGRKLESPTSDAIRPTSDKVRQAVFNALHSRGVVHGATVIDAFCGTGALGIEALSQGAAFCSFFDKDPRSAALCRRNLETVGETRFQLLTSDVTKISAKPPEKAPANLIFLDPPYGKDLIPQAIDRLVAGGWVSIDAFYVIECGKAETPALSVPPLDQRLYGDTKIIFAQNTP